MHIIAGALKSRVIKTHKSHKVRPTTGRVRQTLFDLLSTRLYFEGARVLDLFAGSGILGFEALSRGAEFTLFIDKSPIAIKSIQASAADFDVSERIEARKMNALSFLANTTETFNLIFCDPPYAFEHDKDIIDGIFQRHILKQEGYFVYEHPKNKSYESHPCFAFEKNFGITSLSFFTKD